MDQFMNNPAMMSMMEALMNDPEMREIIEKPEVMSKFQGLMDGSTNMSAMMSDPDLMKMMAKMQQMQMGMMGGAGGGGGGFNGAGGAGTGAAAPQADAHGIVHVSSPNHFHGLMEKSKSSKLPLIIDYTATWCGPCKMIAPVFEELASSYANRALFAKVDGDVNRALVSSQGVRAFPTFQVWKDGKKVEEFSGADVNRLRNVVDTHAAEDSSASSSSSKVRFRHFPVKDDELAVYPKMKWELVTPKLKENNAKLAAADDKDKARALSDEQMKHIEKVIDGLNDKVGYHSRVWSDKQFEAVAQLLQWPIAMAGPALHFFRIFILHPSAAQYYAKQREDKKPIAADSKEAEAQPAVDVIQRICQDCVEADSTAQLTTALWCASNLFSKVCMHNALALRYELLLDTVNALLQRKECAAATENEPTVLSVVGVLINLSFVLAYQQQLIKRRDAKALDGKVLEQAKVQLLSAVLEAADKYKQHAKILYRFLVILGTALLDDITLTELATDLEMRALVAESKKLHAGDNNITAAADELNTLLETQTKK